MLNAIGIAAMLMTTQPVHAKATSFGEDEPVAVKAKVKTTTSTSRSNSIVKIYPDIIKRTMHVVVKEDNEGAPVDFFIFDLHGTLVQNSRMKQRDHLKVTGLARGKYIYRVFAGDTETVSGQFEIR